jgi:hypothetical protein
MADPWTGRHLVKLQSQSPVTPEHQQQTFAPVSFVSIFFVLINRLEGRHFFQESCSLIGIRLNKVIICSLGEIFG